MGRSQLDCSCGGRFRRLNVVRIPAGSPPFYYRHDTYSIVDITPGTATYECNKCKQRRYQKLRLPKPKFPVINWGI
jgi:hypothetical protein